MGQIEKERTRWWEWLFLIVPVCALLGFVVWRVYAGPTFLSSWYREHGTYRVERIEGPFTVELDLTDPESNVGRVVYQEGDRTLYIDQVDYDPESRDIGQIHLRSRASYGLLGTQAITVFDRDLSDDSREIVYRLGDTEAVDAWCRGFGGDRLSASFSLPYGHERILTPGTTDHYTGSPVPIPLPDTITLELSCVYLCSWTLF